MVGFRPKIGQNIGKFLYFHKIANITKPREIYFLELGIPQKPQIWTRDTFQKYLGGYRGIFQNFDFLPIFLQFSSYFSSISQFFLLIVIDTVEIHTKPPFLVLSMATKNFDPILVEKRVKMGSEHILRNISKSRETYFLELGTPQKPQIWTRDTFQKYLGGYRGIFAKF